MVYLCIWWGFNAPNQSSHYENDSLALPKVEQQCHKMRVVAGKKHHIPSSQKHSSGSVNTNYQGPLNDGNGS